jgi:hypothetical protein
LEFTEAAAGIGECRLTAGNDLLLLLHFQFLDQAARTDHVRMLLGEALQHRVHIALEGVYTAVDFWNRHTSNGFLLHGFRQQYRLLTE